jgi:hypothetical protein
MTAIEDRALRILVAESTPPRSILVRPQHFGELLWPDTIRVSLHLAHGHALAAAGITGIGGRRDLLRSAARAIGHARRYLLQADGRLPSHILPTTCFLYACEWLTFAAKDRERSRLPPKLPDLGPITHASCDACGGFLPVDIDRCPSCGDRYKLSYGRGAIPVGRPVVPEVLGIRRVTFFDAAEYVTWSPDGQGVLEERCGQCQRGVEACVCSIPAPFAWNDNLSFTPEENAAARKRKALDGHDHDRRLRAIARGTYALSHVERDDLVFTSEDLKR